ncbi:MAG: branched-chain amino acid ABC transporter permease [Candidatus Magasanikbacteria bacterium CG11_big_fil_rev_8_21_14_0_20_39_34]|uniref:Branched-chain amino acid ABC transporter permease n=1 Tax=Candidatus Magasanikbacteria bacterium CG11_big_fil_rev_8_21_14_0_20_39_34 TaxID=1974653 RepID=A0A2H0N443_9BACT|nr:MAG: branched-chain amino acid ABC transporter permease [Candidatus Magasanikbacteria bacterium CG11_big_fil_rev_8_21_14_0_20_39_34]
MIFNQLLINGIIAGSIYALVASGFTLIYSATRFIHFAHGAIAAAGAYLVYTFFVLLGLNFYLASFLAVLSTALVGLFFFAIIYRPLQKRKSSNAIMLIAGLGLMILIENLLLLIFGADVKSLNFLEVARGKEIFGAIITPLQMVIVAISVLLLIFLQFFVKKTKFGKKMLAVADNPELADTTGINAKVIQYAGFGIGSALAGVAGILIGLEQNIEPVMGVMLIVKGFTGAIIGGVTSLPGAILGSYLLGLSENFGIWYLPSGYKDAIAFGLLLIFLLVKPNGILGINKGVRE